MAIHFIGESSSAAPPFDAIFFKSSFDQIVEAAGKDMKRLTLFLSDGSLFEVCEMVDLSDAYMVIRGYNAASDACDLALTVIPYGLIYRLELGPKGSDATRVGFRWVPPAQITKGKTSIRRKN